ncbi:MAG TPA: hypothetical protein VGB65_04305, partial [Allosphingosinicella sp.]
METYTAVLPLVPHPVMPPGAVNGVSVSIAWDGPGEWCLDYMVDAPPEALRLPPAVGPVRAEGLWERTCFELFLRQGDGPGYCEFNFSPSGEWAAYRLDGYRAGLGHLEVPTPRITSTDAAQTALAMEE